LYSTFHFLQKRLGFDKWEEKCRIVDLHFQTDGGQTMTQKFRWRAWMALALILAATVACREPPQTPLTAPETPQIEEFTEDTLAQYQGKVILLNFWAIWCAPCRTELPDMEAVYRKYRDQGAVILAVNVAESSEDIIAFVNKLELTFPVLRDSRRKGMDAYGIRALPTTLFLNAHGQIVARQVGVLDQDSMSAQLEALLD
jgi:thiol-disulfide isomerase/thioredoxin